MMAKRHEIVQLFALFAHEIILVLLAGKPVVCHELVGHGIQSWISVHVHAETGIKVHRKLSVAQAEHHRAKRIHLCAVGHGHKCTVGVYIAFINRVD